jgi:hypothetical protein
MRILDPPVATHRSRLELEYESSPPAGAHVEIASGRCVVTFPLTPAWIIVWAIGVSYALMGMQMIAAAMLDSIFRAFRSPGHMIRAGAVWAALAALHGVQATVMWRQFRAHGHLRRTVIIDAVARTLTVRAERKPAWREWPLPAVRDVTSRPVRRLIPIGPSRPTRVVVVRFRSWRPALTFAFHPPDTAPAERFAAFVEAALAPQRHKPPIATAPEPDPTAPEIPG